VHGESAYFVWLNQGKQSLVADIKKASDRELLHRILAQADVFIQNLAPGAAARAGFDSIKLREQNPRLITVDISGYGEEGAYRDMKAYDLLVQCETGLAAITGAPEQPGRVGVSVCDIACGMHAHAAVLEALIARGQTGEGRGIAVSLFDALADWMTVPLLHQQYAGAAPARVGLHHPSIAPYGAYYCKGSEQVVISIQNEREWVRFCAEVLELPELAADVRFANNPARCANRPALDAEINAVFAQYTRPQLAERLHAGAIAYASVNSVADLAAHSQLRREDVATPSGPVAIVAPPAQVRGAKPVLGAVPDVGEHSAALRREFSPRD
ncbi:MAG: CoA transferase, partial [Halioglobus sp.]|nr:CoA transferase [Halioglobus sp.]